MLLQGLTLASSHFHAGKNCTGILQKLEEIEFQMLRQNGRILNLWSLCSKLDKKRWFKRKFVSFCNDFFHREFESSLDALLKLTNVIRNIMFNSCHFHISLKNILCSYKTIFILSLPTPANIGHFDAQLSHTSLKMTYASKHGPVAFCAKWGSTSFHRACWSSHQDKTELLEGSSFCSLV